MGLNALKGLGGLSGLVYSAAGNGWLPTDIAGLKLWIDFSDITTLYTDSAKTTPVTSDDDVIGAAEDKSGEGNDATQATTANKPLYKTGIQNGLSAGLGDDTDDFLGFPDLGIDGTQTLTVLYVARIDYTGNVANPWSLGNDNTNYQTIRQRLDTGAKLRTEIQGEGYTSLTLGADDTWLLYTMILNGTTLANVTTYVNASSENCSGTQTINITENNLNTLFARERGERSMLGYIGELLIYNAVVSGGDLTNLQSWANTKWAVY